MSAIALITRRFKVDELTVRRLMHDSSCFRSLCDDYVTSCLALARWRNDESKARDYREMIEELETEISRLLKGSEDVTGALTVSGSDRPKGSC